ncbi:response regulator transcription factor [Ruminiclostridium cellobioparum]|uniref:Stage 0 sporulation protein A homolog n=1 Tax=Ruminiclostridium cellobioparum subsp. termitidis CT1112 TaxID=1195236 RepID=S0FY19_RUMCE|nr:response regulator [Ruminiclostridium cellobioparum]EMS73478.1 two-component response regulator receiver domain protein [Ruminiclostridium cellobioparum subsp. termitidis CT1112]
MQKILIVDDEAFARTAIEDSIKAADNTIQVFTASNGDEALKVLSAEDIDIIMTDIKMPGMSGMELLTEIRRLKIETEVIILSSYNEFDLVRQALQLGAFDYLFKPAMLPNDILEVVKKAFVRQKDRISKSKSVTNKIEGHNHPQDRGTFFFELLNGSGIEQDRYLQGLERFNLNGNINKIVVSVFKLNFYQESLVEKFENNINLLKAAVCEAANDILGQGAIHQFISSNFYEYILVSWDGENLTNKEFTDNVEKKIHLIIEFMNTNFKLDFSIGISNVSTTFTDLSKLYLEATFEASKGSLGSGNISYAWEFKGNISLNKEMKIALDYIKNKLGDKNLSLQMVADHVGLSRNYFCKIFKQTMGVNFIEYITRLRVEKARNLYINTDMKIYEIAEKVGYSDWHYLYSVYKKLFGHSMSQEKPGFR